MRTLFSTATTRKELPDQAAKLVAWTKDANPNDQPLSKLGKITRENINSLSASPEAIPGIVEIFERVGGGKPVAATKLKTALVKAVDAEIKRVANAEGHPEQLSIGELRQITPALRPIALIALAYGDDTGYFDSFADVGPRFDRLSDAVSGVERPVLSASDAAIVDTWLTKRAEGGLIDLPSEWKVKLADLPAGMKKTMRAVRGEAGSGYRVIPHLDPASGVYGLHAASTNGPGDEGLVLCRKSGERIAEIVIGDDGSIRSIDPDHPRNLQPSDS